MSNPVPYGAGLFPCYNEGMEKSIFLQNREIKYKYKRLRRARSVTITVKPDTSILVTLPYFIPLQAVEYALQKQAVWILDKIFHFERNKDQVLAGLGPQEYLRYKIKARELIIATAERLNKFYNFDYKKISIRNQSTLWGSCSQDKSLNFSYKLYFLPGHLAEYIVAHELCHLQELNHSRNFWQLVAQTVPDYKKRIAELKKKY